MNQDDFRHLQATVMWMSNLTEQIALLEAKAKITKLTKRERNKLTDLHSQYKYHAKQFK